jgi:hypothetical protein
MSAATVHFDAWQFQGAYQISAASAETSLSFDDYRSMHTQHKAAGRCWVPPFAFNERQLRKVLLLRAWRYLVQHGPLPANVSWQKLNEAATTRALRGYEVRPSASKIQHLMCKRHIEAVRRAGGYLQLQNAVAFRSWRLGQNSVAVGDSLGISPCNVRATLQRLRDIARKLGFDVGSDHPSRGRRRKSPVAPLFSPNDIGSTGRRVSA